MDCIDLAETVKDYFDKNSIKAQSLAIGCSAGLDSMVLLSGIMDFYPHELISCVHVDHGWREDSNEALDFLKSFCLDHSIKFLYHQFKQGELEKKEDIARKARYQVFESLCKQNQIKHLFLAHNLNDQAETVLFRILRGTNIAGLKGIPSTRELNEHVTIHRPLLRLERKILENYASRKNLRHLEDSSNQDPKYARNRIRLKIFPEAEKINERFLDNINKLANIAAQEEVFVSGIIEQELTKIGDLPWDLANFRKLDPFVQRRLLEARFTPQIEFVDIFLQKVMEGGFHRINFKKGKFFTIKQKQIWLELE